jgi:hypothetical protein
MENRIMAQYKVKVAQGFTETTNAGFRRRAGIAVPTTGEFVGELTDEQADEIKADKSLTITRADAKSESTEQAESAARPATRPRVKATKAE